MRMDVNPSGNNIPIPGFNSEFWPGENEAPLPQPDNFAVANGNIANTGRGAETIQHCAVGDENIEIPVWSDDLDVDKNEKSKRNR